MNIKVVFQHAQDWPLSGFFADFTLLLKYLIYTNDNVVEIEFDVRSSLNSGIPFIKENEEIFSKLFIPYKQQNTTYEKIVYVNRYDIVDCSKSIFKAHDLYNKNRNKLYKYNEIFNKYIKLQPHLEEKLKILTTEMKKDCEQTIGIFVRSNALAGEQPTGKMPTRDEYLEAINNLDKSKNIKYFLRIDNNEDLEFYKKNLLNNYHTNIKRSLTNKKDAPHQNSSEYISLEELEEILLEVLLLSKCDKIIHCVSNMAAASLIMNNNQESICLFNKNKKNKVLIWSDPTWALNRIHHDVELYLKDEYDFTYIAYRDQKYINEQINNMFINSKKHLEFDIIITSMWVYYILRDKYPNIPIHNWCFIAYGFAEIKDNNLSNLTNFAVASDCIIDLLPKNIKLHITPISVEPSNFNYKETSRNLEKLGWCGAPSQFWKNSNWTVEIAKKTNLQLSLASRLTLDQLKDWYHSIDLLIVTAGPNKEAETGPLPPFEAIVSGTPVIGTPVGNFRHVPGPKFNTIEEAVLIIEDLKSNPEKKIVLAKEQYDFVIKFWTYKTLSESWRTMFNDVIEKNQPQ